MMWRLWMYGLVVAAGALALSLLISTSYKQGRAEGAAIQAKADQAAYARIMERITNGTLDVSDDDAVLRELCRLAGFKPSDPECSDM